MQINRHAARPLSLEVPWKEFAAHGASPGHVLREEASWTVSVLRFWSVVAFLECCFRLKPSCVVCLLTGFTFVLDISSEI